MIFLNILVVLFILAVFLLSIKGQLILETNAEGEFFVSVKIFLFKIRIAPAKEPRPVNIRKFTARRHRRRLRRKYRGYLKKQELTKARKQKSKAKAKSKPKPKPKEKDESAPPKRSVLDWINIATSIIKICIEKFFKHLHIKVAKLHINVATGDAASTAILYGVIIQSIAYTVELMNTHLKLKDLKKADISVNADYLSEKTTFEMKIIFSLRVWNLFSIMFGALGKAIKKLIETNPQGNDVSSVTLVSNPLKNQPEPQKSKQNN